MTKILKYILFILMFGLISGCNEPSNYDECILKYVKEDMNERAVRAVINACHNKFPDQEDETESDTEVSNKEIDNETAIERVKRAFTLDNSYPLFSNESYIQNELEDVVGSLEIIGWKSHKKNDQTYLVSYTYELNDKLKGYAFEFNTKADIIRRVRFQSIFFIPAPTKEELEQFEK